MVPIDSAPSRIGRPIRSEPYGRGGTLCHDCACRIASLSRTISAGCRGSRSNRANSRPSGSKMAAVTTWRSARNAESVSAAALASPKLMAAVLLRAVASAVVARLRVMRTRVSTMSMGISTRNAHPIDTVVAITPIPVSLRASERFPNHPLRPAISVRP